MTYKFLAAGLLSLAIAAPAGAQAVSDDMRCFNLSNFFAKAEKDGKLRSVAAQSALFYLGRLDGKITPAAMQSALHTRIDPKAAGPLMTACAQHLGRSEQAMQAAIRSSQPPAKH